MSIRVEQSSQTISWFKDRLAEERLEFKPPFQRNPVWLDKHRAYLIDTALRGLPIPEVYIQKETDETGNTVYALVDGQQRIRALIDFTRGEVELMEGFTPGRGGDTWDDLTADEKKAFWNYRLVVREIEGASEADLRDLFQRLNQNTVTLNAQELRNARYKGDFIRTVTDLADQRFWAEQGIVTATEIRRMVDIEFMAELLVGLMHGPQNKKASLDGMFASYEAKVPDKQVWLKEFEAARALTELLVPDLRASRWRGKSDYYSLFLASAEINSTGGLLARKLKKAQVALGNFEKQVTARLSKDGSSRKVPRNVRRYVTAVEKAASDKDRRETRHRVLVDLLGQFQEGQA
ncbi:MAG TPA: DUF262 domain-containing protein [Gemmatimonadaceae bacterium]|nr:DUF262 domain-containing protein [Gemmatimonadaceae bacterium]